LLKKKEGGFFLNHHNKNHLKNNKIRGLYGGMGIHLLRAVPNAAIMFVTFELVSSWLSSEESR
jgi:hypothetical protein